MFGSSTQTIPTVPGVPRHVAIIMDGNGRWAKKRLLPRVAGHRKGLEAVRETVSACSELGVEYLTLFAFSTENWRRPQDEVSFLMELFLRALENEVTRLARNDIRLRVIGSRERFAPQLAERIAAAEARTAGNGGLTLTIAADYGGRWDILQAANAALAAGATTLDEATLAEHLSMAYAPEPDLFIRTGGETRISNFLMWQLAYTELHFTDLLWPDFDRAALDKAFASYRKRERRFGRTSEQLPEGLRRQ
ncbi:polyprenyl diphosphate synthase [Crenobacter cavernae]|uniref:Isoprenyl transferase n=1 Tax=Crenobacter cavernae TaxID=2290923 RepID=A0A345Y830_9NEIS|nr:polyprenyl diphosphate synthase [Crenobacter cavernae]AXK40082.1 di-trans,poly-cis-decaprenylcistransferase [Crenobacter cavernae]